jgi:lambda repressor-like predicted transcriptional regulator
VAPHEGQALRNLGQTLERLAGRGGLSPAELVAVLEDQRWKAMTVEAAVARLLELVSK